MSKTLKLIERLLAMGRNYQALQRPREATHVLGRLAAFRELPAETAEKTHVCLAEVLLQRRKHRPARRHLTAALLMQPDCARYHYLMANALDTRTDDADSERALEHYRQSLELDPKQPRCWSDYGLLCFRLGQVEPGLKAMRKAAELSPDEPFLLGRLVKALCRAEQIDEARRALLAARFRNPRDGRFAKLYNDFMFRRLRKQQAVTRRRTSLALDCERNVLLPFIAAAEPTNPAAGDGKLIRLDQAALPAGTHASHRPARRTDWKHG